ncbi:PAS domain S-box protein [Halopelagius longus]|uniref:histidine kinase n=1 Tax=Halopelagius longus TaxID=1236180 RepID=A0A1H1D702_9EURY|nr:ATP-binding protein [Halopelagius longus]RDI71199.1 PAS domain S-box protein [Halopelagius longus]SDQ72224.1 PAS domain S-box-containing protein [Halopelagius longus]
MGTSSPEPGVTSEEVRRLFGELAEPSTPVAAATVAEELDASRGAARDALERLADRGDLRSTEIAGGMRVWWRPETDESPDDSRCEERERRLSKYEAIVETVDDGIYVKDDDGVFTMVNDAYADLTGYDRGELVGAHASLVVDEDTIDRAKARKEAAADEDEADLTMEATILTADGDRIPAEATFATIETDGRTEQIGVVRDVSDRKEYRRQLEESNERLEQFAYAASHDLQEPLRMVSSFLRLIERRYADELDEDGREYIEFAVDGADRMRDMIDGLLEYSRVETRGDPFEPVALEAVLSDVCEDLRVRIEETDAEITAEELPRVGGDPNQLRQVFQNLLDNAIEYSGDEPPRVEVAAERDGGEWTISVRDEGIGIDPANADTVFEVFQRLHDREKHPGTGIGLALCERIVERHGGDIWVESELGEGATFSVTLPAIDGADG